jgi:hypothetical protein
MGQPWSLLQTPSLGRVCVWRSGWSGLTRLSWRPRPSPFGREDLRRDVGVRLAPAPLAGGLGLTVSTSQHAWSSFRELFPALITLEGGRGGREGERQFYIFVISKILMVNRNAIMNLKQ